MIAWSIESYEVLTPQKERLKVLQNVKAFALPGRILAVMGASGSGKTSMLDALCSRLPSKNLKSTIKLESKESAGNVKFSYVAQADTLLNTATVFETMETSLLLRNESLDSKTVKEMVDNILEEMGLAHRADAYVGGGELRSLSGGEKRRVSIGAELVSTNSPVLCCDEPTTGLDSATAEQVMGCLRTLAQKKGIAVIATIHQPNSTIVGMFDDFLLLNAGKVAYFGPYNETVAFFKSNGYECPLYSNPTDFFISIMAQPGAADILAVAQEARWNATFAPSVEKRLASNVRLISADSAETGGVSVLHQTKVLTLRAARQWIRDPGMFTSELVQYIFISLFLGGMYYKIDLDVSRGVFDRSASLFFIVSVLVFTPPFTAITTFSLERTIFRKERGDKLYSVFSWLGAKTMTTWPMETFLSLIFTLIIYYMVGFQQTATKFFRFYLIIVLFQLCGESAGLMFAVANSSPIYAIVWMSLVLIVALSLTGFLTSQMPSYYIWIQDSNAFRFALLALLTNEFEGLEFTDSTGAVVAVGLDALPPSLKPSYSYETYVGILIAFIVGMRIIIAMELLFIDVNYMEAFRSLFERNATKVEVPSDPKDAARDIPEVELSLVPENAKSIV